MRPLRSLLLLTFAGLVFSCLEEEKQPEKFSFTVSNDYVQENEQRWLFISGSKGETLYYSKVNNGETINADINVTQKSGFVLTLVVHQQSPHSEHNYSINSYTDIKCGQYVLEKSSSTPKPYVGDHQITIKDVPAFINSGIFGPNVQGAGSSHSNNVVKVTANLSAQTTDLTCFVHAALNSPPKYKKLPGASVGGVSQVSLGDMTPMAGPSIIDLGNVDQYGYFIQGTQEPGNYRNAILMYGKSFVPTSPNSLLSIYYPNDLYAEYHTNVWYTKEDVTCNYTHVGSRPPSTFKSMSASINTLSVVDKTITLKTSGSYDYSFVSAVSTRQIDGKQFYFYWRFEFPLADTKTVEIPVIPQEILTEHAALAEHVFDFNFTGVIDYSMLNGYDDYVRKKFIDNEGLFVKSKDCTYIWKAF